MTRVYDARRVDPRSPTAGDERRTRRTEESASVGVRLAEGHHRAAPSSKRSMEETNEAARTFVEWRTGESCSRIGRADPNRAVP